MNSHHTTLIYGIILVLDNGLQNYSYLMYKHKSLKSLCQLGLIDTTAIGTDPQQIRLHTRVITLIFYR